jgi:hypothetical protein
MYNKYSASCQETSATQSQTTQFSFPSVIRKSQIEDRRASSASDEVLSWIAQETLLGSPFEGVRVRQGQGPQAVFARVTDKPGTGQTLRTFCQNFFRWGSECRTGLNFLWVPLKGGPKQQEHA